MKRLSGLILCGGRSSRMGQDKSQVLYKDKTMLQHAVDLMEALHIPYYLSINQNQAYLSEQYQTITDLQPDLGPLGGICSALDTLETNLICLPVDMPDLQLEPLKQLLAEAQEQMACFQTAGRIQPFPSYWPLSVKAELHQALDKRELSLTQVMADNGANFIEYPEEHWPKNINRPDDLH
ncbi:molybdenum cofactor guanylyltransferase [Roseivirga sp.]|uniref:molybdenum cofactor guanylyltransferase n=1 Tax=Roseivirga sp. TaxID=1964215 RepID=UPI003B518CEE